MKDINCNDIASFECLPSDFSNAFAFLKKQSIKQIISLSFYSEQNPQNNFLSFLSMNKKITGSSYYIVNNEASYLFDKKINDLIYQNNQFGLETYFLSLSTLPSSLHMKVFELIILDNKYVIYAKRSQSTKEVLKYSFFCEENTVANAIKTIHSIIDSFKFYKTKNIDFSAVLSQSADLNYKMALEHCTKSYVDEKSCMWYHSVWQYLRLLGMVSSPEWHEEFFIKHITDVINIHKKASVLISGTADFSMLAYVINCCKANKKKAEIFVLDLCETPLRMCRWYADKENYPIHIVKEDILKLSQDKKFDFICSDAFLTRFSIANVTKVLNKWKALLSIDGKIATTIRIRNDKNNLIQETNKTAFVEETMMRFEKWKYFCNITVEQLEKMTYEYSQNMKSTNLGDVSQIKMLFSKANLSLECINHIHTCGELQPTDYLEIVAKGTKNNEFKS